MSQMSTIFFKELQHIVVHIYNLYKSQAKYRKLVYIHAKT